MIKQWILSLKQIIQSYLPVLSGGPPSEGRSITGNREQVTSK